MQTATVVSKAASSALSINSVSLQAESHYAVIKQLMWSQGQLCIYFMQLTSFDTHAHIA